MTRLKQFEPLAIHDFEEAEFHLPVHSHTYYEIIYIHNGCGIHHLNNNQLPYKEGDIFLLSPEDEHYFEIEKSTRFTYIKFTDDYFSNNNYLAPTAWTHMRPEAVMQHKLLKEMKLQFNEPCRSILKNTIDNIVAYNCRKDVGSSAIMFFQILSIFGLVREGLVKMDVHLNNSLPDKEKLLSYIHQHIYEPHTVQVKQIAAHFNIAPNYFSAYFKRNFDMSYKEYLNNYRTRLIEKRFTNGGLTLKQIASEFGFTDESHLSKFFKKKTEQNPSSYRKNNVPANDRVSLPA
ncbi:AraC-like ligand binding domain-containing protein [Filimonas lacunae]|uniref:AraC-like ligand binding domain-containing protein n=1 Tax=Filimonas lacunae TaxID=477680 RepID=A0A173MME3_9BACT|nr:AraC family transcriptional regulator [Filimonas lacunae]BAV08656.1 transcriptional regulator, AraC family [Filimonas lacunae]SIS59382.1 AraC-like ligand binding domain-containing protein [Filimonas lacunae]